MVLNTNLGGWGEEKRGFSEFPFKRGEYFDTFIIATEKQFRVSMLFAMVTFKNYKLKRQYKPLEIIKYSVVEMTAAIRI